MGKLSKTAQASMKAGQTGPKDAVVISDAERVRLIRMECAQNIYPSCENAHALLREYDVVAGEYARIIVSLATELTAEKETVEILAESTSALLKRAEAAEEEVVRLDQLATKLEDRAVKAEEACSFSIMLNESLRARIAEPVPTLDLGTTSLNTLSPEPLPQPTSEPLPEEKGII